MTEDTEADTAEVIVVEEVVVVEVMAEIIIAGHHQGIAVTTMTGTAEATIVIMTATIADILPLPLLTIATMMVTDAALTGNSS
jgi:hypothetical protein